MNTPPHDKIAERAYQLWQQAFCPSGRDEEFWFQAEAQLTTDCPEAPSPFGADCPERSGLCCESASPLAKPISKSVSSSRRKRKK